MNFNAEQDLHTGEVVGSIPTAPTIASVRTHSANFSSANPADLCAHVSAQETHAATTGRYSHLSADPPPASQRGNRISTGRLRS
jgi:hypothetical protein